MNKTPRFFTSVLLSLIVVAAPAIGQDNRDSEAAQNERVVQRPRIPDAPNTRTPATTTQSKNDPNDKVFKPTEEISEDLPVPFPVDI